MQGRIINNHLLSSLPFYSAWPLSFIMCPLFHKEKFQLSYLLALWNEENVKEPPLHSWTPFAHFLSYFLAKKFWPNIWLCKSNILSFFWPLRFEVYICQFLLFTVSSESWVRNVDSSSSWNLISNNSFSPTWFMLAGSFSNPHGSRKVQLHS